MAHCQILHTLWGLFRLIFAVVSFCWKISNVACAPLPPPCLQYCILQTRWRWALSINILVLSRVLYMLGILIALYIFPIVSLRCWLRLDMFSVQQYGFPHCFSICLWHMLKSELLALGRNLIVFIKKDDLWTRNRPPCVIKQQQAGSQNHYLKASAVTRSSRKDRVAGRFVQSGTSVSHFLSQAILWNIFRIHFEILFEALRLQN